MKKQPGVTFADFGMEPCVLSISDIIPYSRNSRKHSDSQVAEIAASIKEFGWRQPIAIDEKNTIRAGHGRWLAAQKLGQEKVPCLRGKLTETQWRAYVIADNRLAEKATWDVEMLQLEIQELQLANFDIQITGFDEQQIKIMVEDDPTAGIDLDEDKGPPEDGPEEKKQYHCPKCGFVFEV